jgi:amino acid transporter
VTALPCNGGTYNILLNCTSKQVASVAAVFAVIAYITTGVVSALTAVAYLQTVIPDAIDLQTATILLLLFFCLLTNVGISESATFAKYVFVTHVATLVVLCVFGVLYMLANTELLMENLRSGYPEVDAAGVTISGSFWTALFYGFSSAMLGVSGFETSSQFVEEQAPGVFPKTLRNMWAGVIIFNPLLSLISFAALPVATICENKDTVLAGTAHVVGRWVHEKVREVDQEGQLRQKWLLGGS